MYPGECGYVVWDEGPSGLRSDVRANAHVLLHVAFLQAHFGHATARSLAGNDFLDHILALLQAIRSELERMEHLRRDEWRRQQYLSANVAAAGTMQLSSRPVFYNTGICLCRIFT